MKSSTRNATSAGFIGLAGVLVWSLASVNIVAAPQTPPKATPKPAATGIQTSAAQAKLFDTPQQAADALVEAAGNFDVSALLAILGADGDTIVFSGEFAQDKKHATDFAEQARGKRSVSVDPKAGRRAFLLVGDEEWPFPVPIVQRGAKWSFDSQAGRQELVYRRIGANELDAIDVCRGYVEAQQEYATQQRAVNDVNQYAQRIVSTAGKHDGLAWQNPDGTWGGPVGQNIARAIEQGYTSASEPYHGYFFKILTQQGPAAPLGEVDFVVKGVMIGGFALIAAPAEYGVTGIRTFIVSHDGVVYEKDLGVRTLEEFKKTESYNPDASWTPVSSNQ